MTTAAQLLNSGLEVGSSGWEQTKLTKALHTEKSRIKICFQKNIEVKVISKEPVKKSGGGRRSEN